MRKLMWFTIGFAIACAFCAYFVPQWLLVAALICVGVAILFGVAGAWVKESKCAAVAFLGMAVGLLWFGTYENLYLKSAMDLDGKTDFAQILVTDYSVDKDYGTAVDGHITLDGRVHRVRVYVNEHMDLKPGDRLVGQFRFRYTSDGGSQDIMYQRSEGIFLMAYQKGNVVAERFWSMPMLGCIAQWRQSLTEMIEQSFDEDVAGFCKALLLGDGSDIDYEIGTAFTVSGIRHIIAVSGLHVSILLGLVYVITFRKKVLIAAVGIPALVLFAAIAGFSPSVVRASVMHILMMLAMLFEREYDPPTALSFSGLLMLVGNPLVITSVSFQLTFACMVGIFLFSVPICNFLMDEKRMGRWNKRIVGRIATSIAILLSSMVSTTPLVVAYFGTVSLVAAVTNILTLWMVTVVFYGIMVVCLLGFVASGIARFVAGIVGWAVRYIFCVAKIMAAFPLAAVYTESQYIVAWLVLCYVLLGIYLFMKDKPALLFSGLIISTLCLCLTLSWLEPQLDNYRMTMLDVGQGQAIILQSDGRTYLVDCGGDYDEDAADLTAQTLLSQGISTVDGVILTHYDRDHAGGLQYLLTRIDTDLLILPDLADEKAVGERLQTVASGATVVVNQDMQIAYDDTIITVFAPESNNLGNEGSICVLFQRRNCDILITGDRGVDGEKLLMHDYTLPQVDVLVVGHHGSKHSTGQELLETVRPTYAFISVSENNSFGHPAQELLQRLLDMGCIIYRTDQDGTIIFRG